ncbi:hypothetical protein CCHL11_05504 [Colletotrichum chlorophyti]|uniref:Uncharacterized protein n=1 Tax=Colletotrichum chlorophyti TaxID=708187 RepID=A0A1Q8RBF1_9PEZI|nr:hypothetical protein CCHL11_05504 [Colletotrichum chlorophyti]
MTRTARSSTICEWALGVSVEEYCDSIERRRHRKSSGRRRISVEISTDDESEEDTVKITYPRTSRSQDPANIKKVRFNNVAPKSALKTSDADIAKESNRDSDTHSSGNSKNEESARVDDTSDSDEAPKSKKAHKKNKKAKDEKTGLKKKKKKASTSSSESDESGAETTETEREAEAPLPPKEKLVEAEKAKTKQKAPKKKKKEKTIIAAVEPNNVGPTAKKINEKHAERKREKSKNAEDTPKMRPEAALFPHLRRPNLIMPVRAEVLQVEHTIEGVEDPRPNAFLDPQHGVVRVYHGPAYGNPYGLLYPARNPNKATLPIGVPHPLQNPYFHGFANPANPGDNRFQGQSPWGAVPVTYMPGGPPVMASIDPSQIPPLWAPVSAEKSSSKVLSKPVMSGAVQEDAASTAAGKDKEKGWDTNVGPKENKNSCEKKQLGSNVPPTSPININLTVNPNTPWAEFANDLGKKSSPDKNGSHTGSKVNGGGSRNGSKKSCGSKKTTQWEPLASGQHTDLSWDTPAKDHGSNSSWAPIGDTTNDAWARSGGNGSISNWNNTGNCRNNAAWGASGNNQSTEAWTAPGNQAQTTLDGDKNRTSSNGNGWGDSGNNNQAMNNDGWGATTYQDGNAWATGGGYANWTTASNHSDSKKSNKGRNGGGSNRSASGRAMPSNGWDGQSNNVGYSGRIVSDSSHRSKKIEVPASNGGWDNNAGPTTNSPVGDASAQSGGSKKNSNKDAKNNDVKNTGNTSAWPSDNNAGPATKSPDNSQTSKKSSGSGEKGNDIAWSAGNGAGWGPETTSGEVNFGQTVTEVSKASSSSKSMPGAWLENDGLPVWGDTTLAQSTNGAADMW